MRAKERSAPSAGTGGRPGAFLPSHATNVSDLRPRDAEPPIRITCHLTQHLLRIHRIVRIANAPERQRISQRAIAHEVDALSRRHADLCKKRHFAAGRQKASPHIRQHATIGQLERRGLDGVVATRMIEHRCSLRFADRSDASFLAHRHFPRLARNPCRTYTIRTLLPATAVRSLVMTLLLCFSLAALFARSEVYT